MFEFFAFLVRYINKNYTHIYELCNWLWLTKIKKHLTFSRNVNPSLQQSLSGKNLREDKCSTLPQILI